MENKYKLASLMRYGVNSAIKITDETEENDIDRLRVKDALDRIEELAFVLNEEENSQFIALIKREITKLTNVRKRIDSLFTDEEFETEEKVFISHVLQDITYNFKQEIPNSKGIITFFRQVQITLEKRYIKEENISDLPTAINAINNLINIIRDGAESKEIKTAKGIVEKHISNLSKTDLDTLFSIVGAMNESVIGVKTSLETLYGKISNQGYVIDTKVALKPNVDEITKTLKTLNSIDGIYNELFIAIDARQHSLDTLNLQLSNPNNKE